MYNRNTIVRESPLLSRKENIIVINRGFFFFFFFNCECILIVQSTNVVRPFPFTFTRAIITFEVGCT